MPIVGISCNLKVDGRFRHHTTGEGNAVAILDSAGALPLLIPALGLRLEPDAVLDAVDGIMLTGGVSNIEPHHYGQEPAPGEDVRDPGRDILSFALVLGAISRGVPLLGVCRGIQEMNVALGGTLHQRLHEVPGRRDHRRNREIPFEESIAPRDRLRLTPGGRLATWLGAEEAVVNSLHGQGIDRLAPALAVEALGGRRHDRGGARARCGHVRGRRAVARRDRGRGASPQPGDTEGVRRCRAPPRVAPSWRRPRRGGGLTNAGASGRQRRARGRNGRGRNHRTER